MQQARHRESKGHRQNTFSCTPVICSSSFACPLVNPQVQHFMSITKHAQLALLPPAMPPFARRCMFHKQNAALRNPILCFLLPPHPQIQYFMSKADAVDKEHDRQRVLIQITQNLATRIRNSHAFNLPTFYLPREDGSDPGIPNAIEEVCGGGGGARAGEAAGRQAEGGCGRRCVVVARRELGRQRGGMRKESVSARIEGWQRVWKDRVGKPGAEWSWAARVRLVGAMWSLRRKPFGVSFPNMLAPCAWPQVCKEIYKSINSTVQKNLRRLKVRHGIWLRRIWHRVATKPLGEQGT